MDARRPGPSSARLVPAWLALALLPLLAGASHRTTNFVVEAPSTDIAKQVAEHAEACRVSIAKAWLGHELPAWPNPCPIRVKLTRGEAGGLTSFGFTGARSPTSR